MTNILDSVEPPSDAVKKVLRFAMAQIQDFDDAECRQHGFRRETLEKAEQWLRSTQKFSTKAHRKQVLLEAAEIADAGVVQGNHGNDVMTRHNIGNELRRLADQEGDERE